MSAMQEENEAVDEGRAEKLHSPLARFSRGGFPDPQPVSLFYSHTRRLNDSFIHYFSFFFLHSHSWFFFLHVKKMSPASNTIIVLTI